MAYDAAEDGRRDFHFHYGRWQVTHRRRSGADGEGWDVFEGTSFCQGLMGGLANVDEHEMEGGFQGLAVRSFDPATGLWTLRWLDGLGGELPPLTGRFQDGVGRFEGEGQEDGEPVKLAYLWEPVAPGSARWTHLVARDTGDSWETLWTMDFRRAP